MPKEKLSTKKLTRIFKALANERRLIIMKLLNHNPSAVINLGEELRISFRSVSKHLQKLERESLVFREQKGKLAVYQISDTFKKSGLMNQIKESNKYEKV